MVDLEKMRRDLVRDEGVRLRAYVDTTGNWTIGVGHKIRHGDGLSQRSMLTNDQAMTLLDEDIAEHWDALVHALPWVTGLDEVRQRAVLNMAYNLGVPGLCAFTPTLAHVQREEWSDVVEHLGHTKWAWQVGARATRIAQQLLTGADPEVAHA